MDSTRTDSRIYDSAFFEANAESSLRSSQAVIPLLMDLISPRSVVDVGCGSGGWLRTLADAGVRDMLGVDGNYVDNSKLLIPTSQFRTADLRVGLSLTRTFDLALCLEVAEHLPPKSGPILVESLCKLSPVVAFSAASPLQPGVHHLNPRWPSYWAKLFADHGFLAFDCIRRLIWNLRDVDFWYAQNLLIYAEKSSLQHLPKLSGMRQTRPARVKSYVHPRMFWIGIEKLRSRPSITLKKILELPVAWMS